MLNFAQVGVIWLVFASSQKMGSRCGGLSLPPRCLDTLHMIFLSSAMYYYDVPSHGNPAELNRFLWPYAVSSGRQDAHMQAKY